LIAGPEKRFKFPVTKNPMKTYKPDLNERVTIRLSIDAKRSINALCADTDFDESTMIRMALEAGIRLVREQGLSKMIEKRQEGILPVRKRASATTAPSKKAKVSLRIIKNAVGKSWHIEDTAGKELAIGPLYDMRSKAKTLCPEGHGIEIIHPDGKKERLA